ncbi:hypothetical protein BH23VER1_BH23VER1_11700 [soil metagenome]
MNLKSANPKQTREFGAEVGRSLAGGECLALCGDLGTGKTQFVKGLVAGLGGDAAAVTSPTFSIVHEYSGAPLRLPVFHFDFYRLGTSNEVEAVGWDEYLAESGVVVVEWASKFAELLPANSQWWQFTEPSPEHRLISRLTEIPGVAVRA